MWFRLEIFAEPMELPLQVILVVAVVEVVVVEQVVSQKHSSAPAGEVDLMQPAVDSRIPL